jgi:ABC-2 type transport system permease protein
VTALRVLAQLRGDRRTVALLLIVPGVLLVLLNQMFDSRPDFDRVALVLLGIFPFTMMFLVTSVAMLRERTSGTLERLLTTPMSKLDLLLGYGAAFALAAAVQAAVTCAIAYGLLGLSAPGSPWLVLVVAVVSGDLGMALGLLASAFATSEFQAVQFMPAVVMPQILLGGLFVPRTQDDRVVADGQRCTPPHLRHRRATGADGVTVRVLPRCRPRPRQHPLPPLRRPLRLGRRAR